MKRRKRLKRHKNNTPLAAGPMAPGLRVDSSQAPPKGGPETAEAYGRRASVARFPRCKRESNSRPFSVWGKRGEKTFPAQGRGERHLEAFKAL